MLHYRNVWLPLILLSFPIAAPAQSLAGCRSFVQSFYDTYLRQDAHSANYVTEFRKHPSFFSEVLRDGLRDKARLDSDGTIHGFDFDPFLNAQDDDKPYSVTRVDIRGTTCEAEIASGDTHLKAELQFSDHWRFTDFVYLQEPSSEKRLTELLRKEALQ